MSAATLSRIQSLMVERGLVSVDGLDRARRLSQANGEALHLVLSRLGLVSERDGMQVVAEATGVPLWDGFPDEAVCPASLKFLKSALVVPVAEDGEVVVVAVADPTDPFPLDALNHALERPVRAVLATASDIEAAIDRLYGGKGGKPVEDVAADSAVADEEDVARLRDLAAEAPVIRLVNALIARAVDARASDIHIEPAEGQLAVRYRIDGVLRDVDSPPRRLQSAIISRIKIMARLNIAERRLPQDGRIKLSVRGKDVDLRISTLPSIHGESVVMRILDKGALPLELEALGFSGKPLDDFHALLARPNSVLLVTGPTGSGKTTTLYAALRHIASRENKIITVEDPVEYQVPGVTQIMVQSQIGLSFGQILRSILRHDPDVIMVGEIRDVETAEIAVQAALTGHLVLSTLHTNSAAATITRLLDMGVADYLITSTLAGVVAQRLVRRLCPNCRQSYEPMAELVRQTGLDRLDERPRLYRAVGCASCGGSGYLGRTTLFEVLVLGEEVRRLILRHAEAAEIQTAAVAAGMRTMYEDGLAKVLSGLTSLDEVLRVTREN
ncbi:MAG: type II secretion system ATPase GspE [Pseudomonadota bacterium]